MTPSFNERIRQKPKHLRARWAFWSAFLLTGLVAVAWLVYIPGKLERITASYDDAEDPKGNFGRVLDSMKASVGDALSKYRQEFASTTGQFASSTATSTSTGAAPSATTTDSNNIDFRTFFPPAPSDGSVGTSTEQYQIDEYYAGTEADYEPVETAPSVPAGPRQVLIGTSSASSTTQH